MSIGTVEKRTKGMTTNCVWRNLMMFWSKPYANNFGMRNFIYIADILEISGS